MAVLRRHSPLVLCYHAVAADWEHELSVRPSAFERQIRRLSRLYAPLPPEDVVSSRRRGMHVTFDDAFRSIAGALDILRRTGVPATVFASTAYASNGGALAVPELTEEAAARPQQLATMDWEQLRAVAETGFEVGSHTVTHAHLTELSDRELQRELVDSRAQMEDELGRPCRYLAYPYGEEDDRVRAGAKAAGYTAAYSLASGFVHPDRFAIPRVALWRKDYALRAVAKIAVQHGRRQPVWTGETTTTPA